MQKIKQQNVYITTNEKNALQNSNGTSVRMRNEDNYMSVRKLLYIILGISLLHSIGTTATINYNKLEKELTILREDKSIEKSQGR